MKIKFESNNNELIILLEGSLNSKTADEFLNAVLEKFDEKESLVFDFKGLDYLSSAGLRVILLIQNKVDEASKKLKIINVSSSVREVFEITGFDTFLDIE